MRPLRAALYCRVSTREQNPEMQLHDLRRYAAARGFKVMGEFTDVGISGRKERRPGLDRVMALARDRAVDVILVAAFDRFGRSLAHLVRALEELQHLGVAFVSVREQLDLGSPSGRVMFAVIAAMAEFERELVRERIHAVLRRARGQGVRLGRPPKVFRRDQVAQLRAEGSSYRKIGKRLGISPALALQVYRECHAGADRDAFKNAQQNSRTEGERGKTCSEA